VTDNSDKTAEPVSAAALSSGAGSRRGIAFRPYWWEAAPPDPAVDALPARAEVVVIGAGFTGLSAARTLLRHGSGVVVLDAETPGFGASTRNGGQVGSGNQKFRVRRLVEIHGREKAIALLREGVRMLDYTAALIAEDGIDCHFTRCGRFRGAVRPAHYDSMARDLEDLQAAIGVAFFMVPRAGQHNEIGSDRFHGGSVLPNDASLHPGLYHDGLLAGVRARGGVVAGKARATAILREKDGFVVVTPRGRISARHVIVTTNGYRSGAVPYLDRRIVPVGSAQIVTGELPDGLLRRLMPSGRVYGNTNRVFSYFRGVPGSARIMWGGRVGRLAPAESMAAFAHLARDLLHTFPDLAGIPITHAWTGQIGYTYDELPHLGVADGIHYAMGYCGTGVSRSTYFGHKIALRLVGDPDGGTAFDDIPFRSHPFHFAAPVAVPLYETWYRFRDATNL